MAQNMVCLANVLCELEKKLYSAVVGWSSIYIYPLQLIESAVEINSVLTGFLPAGSVHFLLFSWKPAPVPYSSDPPEPDRVQFPLAWWSLSTIPCRRQGQDCEAGSTGGQRPEARTRKPEAPQQVTGLQQVPGPTCLHLQLRWIYLMRQSNPLLTSWFTHIITPKSYKILIYSCCNLDITAFLPRKLRSTLTLMGCVFIRSVTLPQRPGKKVKWYGHQGSFHLFKETRREEKVIYKSRGTQ